MAIYPADPISDEQFSKWRFDGTYQARQLAILDLIRIATQAFGGGGYDFDLLNQEATQELIRLLLVDLEAKDFSTETTQLLVKGVIDVIKTNTDKLDVDLSTRNSEATQLLIKAKTDNLDTPLSNLLFDQKLLQVDTVGTTTYLGYANAGTLTSGATWAIKRIVETGSDVSITWADGNNSFDNIWDNRLALTYS